MNDQRDCLPSHQQAQSRHPKEPLPEWRTESHAQRQCDGKTQLDSLTCRLVTWLQFASLYERLVYSAVSEDVGHNHNSKSHPIESELNWGEDAG